VKSARNPHGTLFVIGQCSSGAAFEAHVGFIFTDEERADLVAFLSAL